MASGIYMYYQIGGIEKPKEEKEEKIKKPRTKKRKVVKKENK